MYVPFESESQIFALSEVSTDECLVPTRGGDWNDNGIWNELFLHQWTPEHLYITSTFNSLLNTQYLATSVLAKNATPNQIAEAKFIRALSMFLTLDLFNQVPFRASVVDDYKTLPIILKGDSACNFIINDLTPVIPYLPDYNKSNIIFANKHAARTLLMKLYLNKAVYQNRAHPNFSINSNALDSVIALFHSIENDISISKDYFGNFERNNWNNGNGVGEELIFCLNNSVTENIGGNVGSRWLITLHYNQTPSSWNGFCTLNEFYDLFDINDLRRYQKYQGSDSIYKNTGVNAGFLIDTQFDKNGKIILDRLAQPLVFTRIFSTILTSTDNFDGAGIRVYKYPADIVSNTPTGDIKENEYVIFRFSDVALMAIEAAARKNGGNTPSNELNILNELRIKRGLKALPSANLTDIYNERSRELYWECWRRNDMIRFEKFLQPNSIRLNKSDEKYLLYPIPSSQLSVNSNLLQNFGY